MNRFAELRGKPTKPTAPPAALAATNLQAGDVVVVSGNYQLSDGMAVRLSP